MDKPRLLNLPKILDSRGNLSFIEEEKHFDFKIKRVYLISDVPGGEIRGGHAFKEQKEVIICLSGSFDVITVSKEETQRYSLNRSYYGLYIPNMIWRNMENFSTNAVALVIASTYFNENDYIRNINEYLSF